jgi:hypothetical protein
MFSFSEPVALSLSQTLECLLCADMLTCWRGLHQYDWESLSYTREARWGLNRDEIQVWYKGVLVRQERKLDILLISGPDMSISWINVNIVIPKNVDHCTHIRSEMLSQILFHVIFVTVPWGNIIIHILQIAKLRFREVETLLVETYCTFTVLA